MRKQKHALLAAIAWGLTVLILTGCAIQLGQSNTTVNRTLTDDISQIETANAATSPPSETQTPVGEENAIAIGYVNASEVNLRETASTEAPSLGTLAQNQILILLQEDGDWYQVQNGESPAYVAKRYVTVISPESHLSFATYATANTDGINMRSAPSTSSDSLGTLPVDADLPVIDRESQPGWTLIAHNSLAVYVATKYLNFYE